MFVNNTKLIHTGFTSHSLGDVRLFIGIGINRLFNGRLRQISRRRLNENQAPDSYFTAHIVGLCLHSSGDGLHKKEVNPHVGTFDMMSQLAQRKSLKTDHRGSPSGGIGELQAEGRKIVLFPPGQIIWNSFILAAAAFPLGFVKSVVARVAAGGG